MAKEIQKLFLEQEFELKIRKLEEELKREQFHTKALSTLMNMAEREMKIG